MAVREVVKLRAKLARAQARAKEQEARAAKAEAVLGDLLQDRGVAQELEALLARLKALVAEGLGKVGLEGARLRVLDQRGEHGRFLEWSATLVGVGDVPILFRLMMQQDTDAAEAAEWIRRGRVGELAVRADQPLTLAMARALVGEATRGGARGRVDPGRLPVRGLRQ